MIDLSVIIVTWNAKRFVYECLDSIQRCGHSHSVEVIVVDNASSDGTCALVREKFPNARLFENTANLGFAKANNIGIDAARGRYLALINSDVNIPPGCLDEMVDYLERNREVGLLGPQMLCPDGAIGRSYMRFPTLWRGFCNAMGLHFIFQGSKAFGGILMSDFHTGHTTEVDVLNGWFLVVRQKAIAQVGKLDEQFFMYGEDIDWSYRFCKCHWKRVYFAGARALHYGGASSAVAPVRFYLEMRRANLQLCRKHYGTWGVFAYMVLSGLHEGIRLVGYSILLVSRQSDRSVAAFKVKRSYAGIRWLCGVLGGSEAVKL